MPHRARWSPPKEVEVLRQEEQASWWRCFTDALGIPWSSLAHGWKGVRSPSISIRSDCYWLPKGGSANVTCASFYASSPTSRKDANTLPHRRLQASEFTKGHSTKASSSLRHFYDAASAAIVYQLYLDDFQSFGYPRWDGVSEFVPILSQERESQRPRHTRRNVGRRALTTRLSRAPTNHALHTVNKGSRRSQINSNNGATTAINPPKVLRRGGLPRAPRSQRHHEAPLERGRQP